MFHGSSSLTKYYKYIQFTFVIMYGEYGRSMFGLQLLTLQLRRPQTHRSSKRVQILRKYKNELGSHFQYILMSMGSGDRTLQYTHHNLGSDRYLSSP